MAYTTINKSTDYFNTKLYTGNATARTISGIGFQPDWVWGKSRTNTENNSLFDAVRGAGYDIKSDATNAQSSNTGITAFNSDGYVLGTADSLNSNSQNFVTWNWKANGSGSANSDGTISSTVSVNTTSGFSIVSYTGTLSGSGNTTVGHGLGAAPKMIITKSITAGENWGVYHKDLTANNILQLNTGSAQIDTSSEGTVTAPTSSVFTVNYRGEYGNNGQNYIAYCFAEKTGFSKFGSYTGNGNADGSFIYTGFKPAFVMHKRYSSTGGWYIHDTSRNPFNVSNNVLVANDTGSESAHGSVPFDILSNGFKFRTTVNNASGSNYLYMAFAEAPLVGSNNVPANAR